MFRRSDKATIHCIFVPLSFRPATKIKQNKNKTFKIKHFCGNISASYNVYNITILQPAEFPNRFVTFYVFGDVKVGR